MPVLQYILGAMAKMLSIWETRPMQGDVNRSLMALPRENSLLVSTSEASP
jgi:hypothetical protein